MLVINLVGIALIVLIIWWFWLYSPKKKQKTSANKSNGGISVVVQDGVYQPSTIVLSTNTATTLKFTRKDPSPCAEMVIFPDLEISAELPLNKTLEIPLPKMKKGKYVFHCQMQMYKGYLVVE
ncbi:MAG: plastocyanin domain-containing protein [Psychromonas sp.]|jgi:plastocyanin domain-containing protein|uniref:cupredoxin domain-containing protein n=1 Tax=Psychromonas sp. TaxID=1884585 RepID=UPI0039E2CE69